MPSTLQAVCSRHSTQQDEISTLLVQFNRHTRTHMGRAPKQGEINGLCGGAQSRSLGASSPACHGGGAFGQWLTQLWLGGFGRYRGARSPRAGALGHPQQRFGVSQQPTHHGQLGTRRFAQRVGPLRFAHRGRHLGRQRCVAGRGLVRLRVCRRVIAFGCAQACAWRIGHGASRPSRGACSGTGLACGQRPRGGLGARLAGLLFKPATRLGAGFGARGGRARRLAALASTNLVAADKPSVGR